MGYTVESEQNGNSYHAFDEAGYGLSLDYIGESMNIDLTAPVEMGTLDWPKSDIAGLIPVPKSTVGKVSADTSDSCYIYVGETSIGDFNDYVDACSEQGFAVDYDRGDQYYNADDADGNHLSVTYEGNKVMTIRLDKADGVGSEHEDPVPLETTQESAKVQEPAETEAAGGTELVDGMRPEFKQAMDSYEEFMNEYCDFMEKYAESDGTDVGLLADYADYMSQYAEAMEAFDAWDDGEMNTTEMEYYLQVQTRVNERLLETAE